MSNEDKTRDPCTWCGGFEPTPGVDPRTLSPTEFCNPNFCRLARHDETRESNLAKVARLLGRPVTPLRVIDKLDWWMARNKRGGYSARPTQPNREARHG